MQREKLIKRLSNNSLLVRKSAIRRIALKDKAENKKLVGDNVFQLNIQTNNSVSKFSPSLAVYMAYNTGLKVCGITDRNTLIGAKEFACSAQNAGLNYSIGFETFVDIEGKMQRINVYGVSINKIKDFQKILEFNRQTAFNNTKEHLKTALKQFKDISLDESFEQRSEKIISKGGSVSIKNLYFEVGEKLIAKYQKGEKIVEFLLSLGYEFDEFEQKLLMDTDNAFYEYDLLRILIRHSRDKSIYSYSPLEEFSQKVKANGGFIAYVCKTSEMGEWSKLVKKLKKYNFEALCIDTYKGESLIELNELCKKNEIILLPADYIDSPRKKFANSKCDIYDELTENVYAVIGNQSCVNFDFTGGMFSDKMKEKNPKLADRIKLCAVVGKGV